jgi:hypothetical protein
LPRGDDDYNIKIFGPPVPGTGFMPGGTGANPDNIKGEFDSDETIDHFDRSAWWKMFHQAVDAGGGALIDGHDGIMTGLMGLDTFHSDNRSEIHPVHALAIRIAEAPNPTDDAWAVFVRNWGNEGYCGNNQHYVDRTSLSIRIPRPPGLPSSATASLLGGAPEDCQIEGLTCIFTHNIPTVQSPACIRECVIAWNQCAPEFGRFSAQCMNALTACRTACPIVGEPFFVLNAIPGGDAVVTFHLNTPDVQSYQFGELHLVWAPTSMPPGLTIIASTRAAQVVDEGEEEEGPEESAEDRALFNALSPAEREAILAAVEAARPPVDDTAEPARGATVAGRPEPAPTDQVVFDGPAERVQELRESGLSATCAATDNVSIQLFICEGVPFATIDIEPGEFPNRITISRDPKRIEVTTVAILTAPALFDATTVDPSTVRFGKTGTEAAPVQTALADANGDGTLDLVLRFRTQDAGLQCGDTLALLTGKTVSGEAIGGSDSIVTVRGQPSSRFPVQICGVKSTVSEE